MSHLPLEDAKRLPHEHMPLLHAMHTGDRGLCLDKCQIERVLPANRGTPAICGFTNMLMVLGRNTFRNKLFMMTVVW